MYLFSGLKNVELANDDDLLALHVVAKKTGDANH